MSILSLPTTRLSTLFAKHTSAAQSRLTFFHNPAIQRDPGRHTPVSLLFSHLVYKGLLSKASPSNLLRAIDLLSTHGREGRTLLDMHFSFDGITGGITLTDIDRDDYRWYTEASRLVSEKVGLAPGTAGIIINGRVRTTAPISIPKHDVARI
jgi:UDP-glucose:glycoprotein glucosyltransferase